MNYDLIYKFDNIYLQQLFNITIIFLIYETIPFILTIYNTNLSYGSTRIGKFQQYLNTKLHLNRISWFLINLMIFLLIYNTIQKKYLIETKIVIILVLIFCIYIFIFPILNLINLYLELVLDNPPFIKNKYKEFPKSKELESNYINILKEFKKFEKKYIINCLKTQNPGFKIEYSTNKNNCWRGLYLKKGGKIYEDIKDFFPITINLLKDPQIHNAFFSILDPNVEIPPHIGYYKGYYRYHLGIEIPNGKKKAYIVCGGKKYSWSNGKGVLFDDIFLHYVKNPTNKKRVVLYLDIKRKNLSFLTNKIINFSDLLIETHPLGSIFLKNQHKQKKL